MPSRPSYDRGKGVALGVLGTLLFSVAIFFALSSLYRFGVDGPVSNSVDFRAFYCGGEVWRTGRDPYRVEPMRTCEQRALSDAGLAGNGRTLPAPFPPYALAFFAPFSLFPVRFATELWLTLSVVALAYSALLIFVLTQVRTIGIVLALAFSAGLSSLALGQVVPIVLCAVVFSAWRARLGDGTGAALGAVVAAIEPHAALPLWVGLVAGVPAARRPVGIAAVALLGICVLRSLPLSIEFVTRALPQHARSELFNFSAQYSAAALAAILGSPPAIAGAIGLASYALMLVLGTVAGLQLMRRFGDAAFAALTPVAAVLLGGGFLHIHQMALAVPFALLLFARVPRRSLWSTAILSAIVLLAVPWEAIAEQPFYWDHHAPARHLGPAPALPAALPDESIEVPYTAAIDAFAERSDPRSVLEQFVWKLPTWLALIVVLGYASNELLAARNSPRRS